MRLFLAPLLVVAACGGSSSGLPGDDAAGDDDQAGDAGAGTHDAGASDAPPGSDASNSSDAGDTPISTCANGAWCIEQAPGGVTQDLQGVFAPDANHVFAVGNGGVILLRTNGAWQKMTSGTTEDFRAVWAASATDAWAVGHNGAIQHWNGSSWTAAAGVVANIANSAVWGSGPNDVWVTGTATIQHWNGTAWAHSGLGATPVDIDGSASNDVWMGGENSGIVHYTAAWTGASQPANSTMVPTGVGSTIFSTEAITSTDVWVCGAVCSHWNGMTWTTANTNLISFAQLYGTATDHIFGVSQDDIGFWNGATWSFTTPTGLVSSLRSVNGVGPHTWAVGSGPAIVYHHD
ncbi:MAG TPA: hypothetical protein VGM39_13125 [Kofleriaceae bacterium]|jgi:hypothetical protein